MHLLMELQQLCASTQISSAQHFVVGWTGLDEHRYKPRRWLLKVCVQYQSI